MQPPTVQIADALRQLSQSDALRELETRLAAQNAFNLFDAIGVSTQELRHSDFLAFLLRPHQSHGLGDTFLKWFLGYALANSPAPPPISRDTVNQWDLSDAQVQREWKNIDLFITSTRNQLAVIVENKIYSGEREGQLENYMTVALERGFGGAGQKIFGIYLTPYNGAPTHKEYIPIGYEAICAHLELLCKTSAFSQAANPDVSTVVRHYTAMLRKKILGDPEITKLCREIYINHQAAFDRILSEQFGVRQTQKNTTAILREAVAASAEFDVDPLFFWNGIYGFHFIPRTWPEDAKPYLSMKYGRLLYFQAETLSTGEIRILGLIAPSQSPLRQRIVDIVQSRLSIIVPQPSINGYAGFYHFVLRPASNEALMAEEAATLWEEWIMNEASQFATLVQTGDFANV